MGLLERLRSFADGAPAEQLPTDVYFALVENLFAPFVSFAVAAAIVPIAGAVAAWRTGNPWLAMLAAATTIVAVVRILIIWRYHRNRADLTDDKIALRRWERRYEIGADIYSAGIGAMCFVAFVFTGDAVSQLLFNTTAMAYTAGSVARNASRPRVAVAQLSLILLPAGLGAALHRDPAYAALALIIVLYFAAAFEIVQRLGARHLHLLLTTREKVELARSLAEQNVRFDAALTNMPHGLCMFDARGRLQVWNRRFCEIYQIAPGAMSAGIGIEELVELSAEGRSDPDRTAAMIAAEYAAHLASRVAHSYKRQLPTGHIIAISHQPMADDGTVVICEDVTEREQLENRVKYLATHDELTGLVNREVFTQTVKEAIKVGRRYGRQFAIMFVDLDRFKFINDTLGHAAGDTLLVEIAKRLTQCVRKSDVVSRIGGDEFVVMLREISNRQRVTAVVQKILAAVAKPMIIHGQECRVTTSIGISLFPSDAADEETLTRNADAAMYAAKAEGRNNFLFHTREIRSQSTERLMLEAGLRRALERNELVLYYQPKRDLGRGSISGVEALLRWQHPDLGLLLPDRFIVAAEETGLIVPIGQWVLETACAQNMAWQRDGLPPVRMSVNLSPRQFGDPGLLDDIRSALEKSGMAPQLLELELTENMIMWNMEHAMRVLQAIKRLGIAVSIDDFGTGYSSMSLVKKLPLDSLKIDRSLVHEITGHADDKAIAEAIIALGRALDLRVVAEGVETAEQEAILRACNCDEIQGYLISKPVPADDLAAFLASQAQFKELAAAVPSARNRAAG